MSTAVATDQDVGFVRDLSGGIVRNVERVIAGKREAVDAVVCTLLAGGHVLVEDVPGVGKTALATALARSVSARLSRIQFTSDMLPTDVTGVSVFDQRTHEFTFHPGPVFANVVIGDEINRATPKTQSALLEAMGEQQVTVDGDTRALPSPFIVVATQNPSDMEGTFQLPEAQRDRFMARISLGYPAAEAELEMLEARTDSDPMDLLEPVADSGDVLRAQRIVHGVYVADELGRYLVAVVDATRRSDELTLGASPRATLHLAQMCRARAAMEGRTFATPDDVAALAVIVLAHRLLPRGHMGSQADARAAADRVVRRILARVPLPDLP